MRIFPSFENFSPDLEPATLSSFHLWFHRKRMTKPLPVDRPLLLIPHFHHNNQAPFHSTITMTEEKHPCDEIDETIEIPSEFVCPLTLQLMTDPVVTRYGQSYERSAIVEWIAKGKDCPMTRQPLSLGGIITNHALRAKIRHWQVQNELPIVLISHDPSSLGMFGYFMIPKKEEETERSSADGEEEITVREVSPNSAAQPPAPRRRRGLFFRRLRRGSTRVPTPQA